MKLTTSPRRLFILSIGILLLAATLRLWRIASLPDGLFTDEAYHLRQAQAIVHGQGLPVFITGNNGYEPLFVYLVAALLPILGPVTWAGRLAAAWLGLISVAATIRAGKELFPGRAVGALAGLSLATLLWSLTFSRFGSQPILAAPAAAGALAAFWHGVRTRSRWAYALAGVCVGLGLDGYIAFRLFPIVLAAATLALLIGHRRDWRQWLVGLTITAGMAAMVFAPLAWFFLHHPEWFFHRFNQTTTSVLNAEDRLTKLAANGLKVVGGLFVAGDQNWRHNLAGRPALDVAQALFFVAALGAAVRQRRRPETWTLLAWLVIGLVPSLITIDAPHFGRTTLIMPVVALLVGLGVEAMWRWSKSRLARGLIVAAVASSAVLSMSDFWGRWASAPQLSEAFSGDQVEVARAVNAVVPPRANLDLYLTSVASPDWSLEYMLEARGIQPHIILGNTNCRFFPSLEADDNYVAFDDPAQAAGLTGLYPTETVTTGPHLNVAFVPTEEVPRWPVDHLRSVQVGGFVKMAGYSLTSLPPVPGKDLQLEVIWEANQPMTTDYKLFVHLLGAPKQDGSAIYSQLDVQPCGGAYPTSQWQTGDTLAATYSLGVPADLPAGSYTLNFGWYEEATGQRLALTDEAHRPLGDSLPLAQFQLSPVTRPPG